MARLDHKIVVSHKRVTCSRWSVLYTKYWQNHVKWWFNGRVLVGEVVWC